MTAEFFYDHGVCLYVPDTGELPTFPYWKLFMGIAVKCSKIQTFDDFNIFVGEDEEVLAIQMPAPANKDGVPVESVLHGLREILPEEEISELISIVCAAQESPELTGSEIQ